MGGKLSQTSSNQKEYQGGWDGIQPNDNLEHEQPFENKCLYNIGTDGEWHKITFTGDFGAVDHVMKRIEATWIPLKPTAMPKAGFGLTVANGAETNRNHGWKNVSRRNRT